jgi:nucleoside-diphosphate-sugar epimerase
MVSSGNNRSGKGRMTRALVTGGTGFIGSHLVEALHARGESVRCLVRRSANTQRLQSLGVELAYGDLQDRAGLETAMQGVETVYHLAGVTKSFRSEDLWLANETGAGNVAEACARSANPPRLIVVSSLAAAGPSPADRARREPDPTSPVSQYGQSKRAGERAAARFASDLPISVVRPPIVFGEGDRDFYRMYQPILKFGTHPIPGFRPQRFALIHAQDLVAGLLLVADRGQSLEPGDDPAAQGYYFLAFDEQPLYADLGRMIAQSIGRSRVRTVRLPSPFTWAAGLLGETVGRVRKVPMIMNWDKAREALAGNWTCDTTRARDELGFRPAKSLAERLDETTAWYRSRGWIA